MIPNELPSAASTLQPRSDRPRVAMPYHDRSSNFLGTFCISAVVDAQRTLGNLEGGNLRSVDYRLTTTTTTGRFGTRRRFDGAIFEATSSRTVFTVILPIYAVSRSGEQIRLRWLELRGGG